MLTSLRSHFKLSTPRIIPQWSQYLESLNLQKRQLKTRFLNSHGYESRGFRLLKQITDLIDPDFISYLLKQPDDYARYLNGFLPLARESARLFQPVESGRAYRKMFYEKGLFSTSEYFCPVDDVDHLSTLPMEEGWESWTEVQPVHLWYNDSPEYTMNVLKGRVEYKYTNPTFAIIFVDTIALMFKYYKYMTSQIDLGTEKTLHKFIHEHVFSFFFEDLQNIWVLNQVLLCTQVPDGEETVDSLMVKIGASNRQYGYVGGRHQEAVEHLLDAMDDVRDGNIRVNSLLSSKLLPSGSIIDRIYYSFKYLDVAHTQQLKYMRMLRDMPMVDLLLQMNGWRPDNEIYKSLVRDLRYQLKRLQSSKPWSRIYDSSIRAHLYAWTESTIEKLG